ASPEQAVGDPVGPPSDLYSLGLVAYELFTGKQAIPHEDEADIIERQVGPEPITLPDDVVVTDTLRATLHRMLAKDQNDRFQSTDELSEALAAWNSPQSFPWEQERLNPSFEPATRDESTDVGQLVNIDDEGTYEPPPTRRTAADAPHRPVPTRPRRARAAPDREKSGALASLRDNLGALLIGAASTLAILGLIWAVWSPWQRREPVELTDSPAAADSVGESLTIRTDPTGTDIRVDGRPIGRSPVSLRHQRLAYPIVVHAEHGAGKRLARKVPRPTDAITLDFWLATTDTGDRDTGMPDIDEGDADPGVAGAPGTESTRSEGPADDSPAPDDETENRETEPPDETSTSAEPPSTADDGPGGDASTESGSDEDPEVIPAIDQNESGGSNNDRSAEDSDADSEISSDSSADSSDDDSQASPNDQDFPALDQ
ncbi:MAG: PEGA domain-containing protein, partial [Bradymonadaceae bacterium]